MLEVSLSNPEITRSIPESKSLTKTSESPKTRGSGRGMSLVERTINAAED